MDMEGIWIMNSLIQCSFFLLMNDGFGSPAAGPQNPPSGSGSGGSSSGSGKFNSLPWLLPLLRHHQGWP